jgi:integrase
MAATRMNVLADVDLRRWLKDKRALAKSDGGGLTFTMSAAGTASWVLRYRSEGRQVELTLGRYPDVTLAAARKLAAEKRVEVQQGRDPAAEKRRAKSRRDWTVRELVADYREMVLPTLAKSTQVSYGRNLKRIETGLGAAKVGEVEAADVVGLIERFDLGWVEANTLLIVQKAIFRRAAGKRLINVNPVVGVELSAVIGPRPRVRQRLMLTRDELAALMNAQMSRTNLLTLRILLATGVRVSELFQARCCTYVGQRQFIAT